MEMRTTTEPPVLAGDEGLVRIERRGRDALRARADEALALDGAPYGVVMLPLDDL
jgi:hypothetical protein